FGDVEFPANHVVARANVAVDVDLLDVDALAVIDHKGQIDPPLLVVAVSLRPHRDEGKALPRAFNRHVLDGFFQQFGVVDVAGIHPQLRLQQPRSEPRHIGANVDRAYAVLLSFLDNEGHHETAALRIVFAACRYDAHVDVPVLEIEPAQQLPVRLDPIGVVGIAGLQESQDTCRGGLDHVPEAGG